MAQHHEAISNRTYPHSPTAHNYPINTTTTTLPIIFAYLQLQQLSSLLKLSTSSGIRYENVPRFQSVAPAVASTLLVPAGTPLQPAAHAVRPAGTSSTTFTLYRHVFMPS